MRRSSTNPKAQAIALFCAVVSLSFLKMELGLINTAMGEIKLAFPQAGETLITLISTLPTLFMFAMTVITGPLTRRFDKRHLVILALSLYVIGGLGGYFFSQNIYTLLASRAVCGVGAGICGPLSGAVIYELYSGKQLNIVLGWNQAWDNIWGFILTMLVGVLCIYNWRYLFFCYAFFLIVLIMAVFVLPPMPPVHTQEQGNKKRDVYFSRPQISRLTFLAIYHFFLMAASMQINMKIAIFMNENQLGNTVLIAAAMSAMSLCSAFAALIFGWVVKFTQRMTPVLAGLCTLAAIFLFLKADRALVCIIAMVINGFGAGLLPPYLIRESLDIVGKKELSAYGTSVILGSNFCGGFATTWLPALVGLYTTYTIPSLWKLCAVIVALCSAAYAVYVLCTRPSAPTAIR